MADPTVVVEIAFGSLPNSPTDQLVWTDVTDDLREWDITRGRNQELDDYSPGTARVILSNADRTYDPTNTSSVYYVGGRTQITPMRRLRIVADGEELFHGFVDSWSQIYNGPNDAVVEVACTDAFKVLSKSSISGSPFVVDITGYSPKYWFRFGETEGAAITTDSISGTSLIRYGNNGSFGAEGLLYQDSNTAYVQATTDDTSRSRLYGSSVTLAPDSSNQRLSLVQNGSSADYACLTTPDASDMDGYSTGIDFRVRLLMPAKGSYQYLFGKGGYASDTGYYFALSPTNTMFANYTYSDTTTKTCLTSSSSILNSLVGQVIWLGYTYSYSGGTWTARFYYNTSASPSSDITTWTQIGSDQTDAKALALQANAILPCIGARGAQSTTNVSTGSGKITTDIYNVQLREGVNGTVRADPDFTNAAEWTIGEKEGDTASDGQRTWTIRRSGTQQSPTIVGSVQPFTCSFLTKINSVSTQYNPRRFLQYGTNVEGWEVYLNSDRSVTFSVFASSGASIGEVVSDTILALDETYHITVTYTSTGLMKLYINGVEDQIATDTEALTIDTVGLTVGNVYTGTLGGPSPTIMIGTIDELVIWDKLIEDADILAVATRALAGWDGDLPNERIDRVLDLIRWADDDRDLDTGLVPLQSQNLSGDALSYVQNAAKSDMFGTVFVTRDGKVAFRGRASLFDQTPVLSISDAYGSDPWVLALSPEYGDWLLRNDVTIQRDGGEVGTAQDSGSIGEYLSQGYSLSGLMNQSDNDSINGAQLIVENYSEPKLRVSQVTLFPRKDPTGALWADVLPLELGDWITLSWKPQGTGAAIELTCVVEQIKHSYRSGGKDWSVVLSLSPALEGSMSYDWLDSDASDLAANINNSTTTVTLTYSTQWTNADVPFNIIMDSEVMTVTAVTPGSPNTTFTVTRAQEGTTAASHTAGADIRLADSYALILG